MQWLESFQNSYDAWHVACSLMDSGGEAELLFFSAQTLKHKVISDLAQIDAASSTALLQSLRGMAFGNRPFPHPVRTQILLAVAGLLVQIPGETLDRELAQGPSEQLLSLLALIPEQLANPAIHLSEPVYRERKEHLVKKSAPAVLPILVGALDSLEHKTLAVEGLQAWIRYADLDAEQTRHVLLVCCQLLGSEDSSLIEGACEIIGELSYKRKDDPAFATAWASSAVPAMCSVVTKLLAEEDELDDTKTLRAVAGVLAETGELYLSETLRLEHLQGALSALIPTLLELTKHPDLSVVETMFNFWSALEASLEGIPNQELREAFVPVYSQLFQQLLPKLQFPAAGQPLSLEERDAFRDMRHVIGDCLKDCLRVIGSSASLEMIWAALDSATAVTAASGQWEPVEAVLFSLRAVSSVIDRRETEVLPRLFPRLLSFTAHPKHVYSVLLIIGCLADWLKGSQGRPFLEPAITFVSAGVQHRGDSSISAAAATAMRYLCESCGQYLLSYFDSISSLYTAACVPGQGLSKSDRLSLTESMCHVLAASNSDSASLEHRLEQCVASHVSVLQQQEQEAEQVDLALEQLSLFVDLVVPEAASAVSPEHPMVGLYLRRVEPLLHGLATRLGPAVDQGMGELLKAAVTRYGRGLGPGWLSAIIDTCYSILPLGLGSMLLVIRYLVLMGDCPEHLQPKVLQGLVHYSSQQGHEIAKFELFQATIACLDYWQDIPVQLLSVMIPLLEFQVSDATAPTADHSSAVQLTLRLGARFFSDSSSPAQVLPAYTGLLKRLLASSLCSFPATVQSDTAVLFHRLSRSSTSIDIVADIVSPVLQSLDAIVPLVERTAWEGQWREAVGESRPKALKSLIGAWAGACRRRALPL